MAVDKRDIERIAKNRASFVQLANLKMSLQTGSGANAVWVLVEGIVDEVFCEKMFRDDSVFIRVASVVGTNGQEHGGKVNVINHVRDCVDIEGYDNVIGIVDRDYENFFPNAPAYRKNIFLTDKRDLEMTLFAQSSVRTYFQSEAKLSSYMPTIVNVVSAMGCLRATAANHLLRYELKSWNLPEVWEKSTGLKEKWKEHLYNRMNSFCIKEKNPMDYAWVVSMSARIQSLDVADYGRGHDFLSLVEYILGSNYSGYILTATMIDIVTLSEIQNMQLYKDIQQWEKNIGYSNLI